MRHDTHHHGDVDELIEPLRVVARGLDYAFTGLAAWRWVKADGA
jgi:hypothetical protein